MSPLKLRHLFQVNPITRRYALMTLATSLTFSAGIGVAIQSFAAAVVMVGLSVSLCYIVLLHRHRSTLPETEIDILPELPQFLEIVTLAVQAGLSFEAALRLYIDSSPGRLGAQLTQALMKSRLGLCSLEHALLEVAHTLQSTELETILTVSFESLRHGVPLVHVLQRQIDLLRTQLRARTQERLERAPVWMLLPTATLILPAMLLSVIGPLLASAFAA